MTQATQERTTLRVIPLLPGEELPPAPRSQTRASVPPREPKRGGWFGWIWPMACILLGGLLLLWGWLPAAAQKEKRAGLKTRPIESIEVGQRVLGKNPSSEGVASDLDEPEESTWRRLKLRMTKPDGRRAEIVLLRSAEWVERQEARAGGTIFLGLLEIGAVGSAEVLEVGPCPPIARGQGSVVTATFRHEPADNLVEVRLKGEEQPIGCTNNHPFWSEDRGKFVAAGQLRPGERLRARLGGPAVVASVTARQRDQWVYNLEVYGQHVYEVTRRGVLVHNTCPDEWLRKGAGSRMPDEIRHLDLTDQKQWDDFVRQFGGEANRAKRGDVLYILYDDVTGEIYKVGHTGLGTEGLGTRTKPRIHGRFYLYQQNGQRLNAMRTAAAPNGYMNHSKLAYVILKEGGDDVVQLEGKLRTMLRKAGHALLWDAEDIGRMTLDGKRILSPRNGHAGRALPYKGLQWLDGAEGTKGHFIRDNWWHRKQLYEWERLLD
jgi:hypothetical protein